MKRSVKKQVEVLLQFVAAPQRYNVNSTTRQYKAICELVAGAEAVRTGHSERRVKWVITKEVCDTLSSFGVESTSSNIAPRGGADGERVALHPEVRNVLAQLFEAFKAPYIASLPARKRKYMCVLDDEAQKAYINTLRGRA